MTPLETCAGDHAPVVRGWPLTTSAICPRCGNHVATTEGPA